MFSVYGIDVSHHQENIDWQKVANNTTPIVKFVFIKATQGETYIDPMFSENWKSVSDTKIMKGAYHYYTSNADPEKQAENFSNTLMLNKFDQGGDWYVLDVEENQVKQPKSEFANGLELFIGKMKQLGFTTTPFIYTATKFWNENLGNDGMGLLSQCNLWCARYYKNTGKIPPEEKDPGELPIGAENWRIWQFTDNNEGSISGVSTKLDIDLSNSAALALRFILMQKLAENTSLNCKVGSLIVAYVDDYSTKTISESLLNQMQVSLDAVHAIEPVLKSPVYTPYRANILATSSSITTRIETHQQVNEFSNQPLMRKNS
jgi:lysozyme